MYLTDYHTHSHFSPDSEARAADMICAAMAAGLRELCLTDHLDFLDAAGKFVGLAGCVLPFYDVQAVRAASDSRFTLRSGVELGEAWEDPELAAQVAACPDLDFIIGSVHNLDSAHGGQDFYFVHYENEQTCRQVLEPYFNAMETMAAMDCYDVIGHVIYPLRYMNGRDGNHVTLDPYLPQLERIFRLAVSKGKGIEVNTCRGETVEDWRPVLGLYRDCGGTVVTLGSDAHTPGDVGKGIPQAAELLKEYGFRLSVYEKRQPKEISLA